MSTGSWYPNLTIFLVGTCLTVVCRTFFSSFLGRYSATLTHYCENSTGRISWSSLLWQGAFFRLDLSFLEKVREMSLVAITYADEVINRGPFLNKNRANLGHRLCIFLQDSCVQKLKFDASLRIMQAFFEACNFSKIT